MQTEDACTPCKLTENGRAPPIAPILDDHEGHVGRMFKARTSPHMFVLDRGGTIAYNGAIDDDPGGTKAESERVNYVRRAVEALLAGELIAVPETKPYGCSVKYK